MNLKKKKFKSGKIRRHKFRKAAGLKTGFGKPWSAPSVPFRVEFMHENADGSEENEQVHWIECRRFKGEEKNFLLAHYAKSKDKWTEQETLESKFVCIYCASFLVENKDKLHINQAFIFPTSKQGSETIRMPIYKIKWTPDLAKNSIFDDALAIVMKNAVYHHPCWEL